MTNTPPEEVPRLRLETIAVAAGRPHGPGAPLNAPIVAASTFEAGAGGEYSRGDGTDSVRALEEAVAALEGGTRALAFASGMAAISAVFDRLDPGARVVVPADSYQGVATVVADGERRLGWEVVRLANADTEGWLAAIEGSDLVWLESPSNPLMEVADVPAICAGARAAGVRCVVDNTFATPLLQRPLDHGATASVHSATKYLGGHSDLLAGVIVTDDPAFALELDHRRTYGGAIIGALEAFLTLRGLRTLPLRLGRAQANARTLAARLAEHRAVTRVRYPGLEGDPGFDLARRTLAGPGAMLSFETVGNARSADIRVSRLRLVRAATSLGAVETTIERRAKLVGQEHIPPTLLRLSVGCEHVEDLWADLDQALNGLVNEPESDH